MKPYIQADLEIAARTIWGEARGETYDGKKAVAHVLLNRWNDDTGVFKRHDTLATVCLWNRQFSVWNASDKNFPKMFDLRDDDQTYRTCQRALFDAMYLPDTTEGSLYYHTLRSRPRWSRGKTPAVVIGGHKFYNSI